MPFNLDDDDDAVYTSPSSPLDPSLTTTNPTVPDYLYVKFHDDLFDILCTTDQQIAIEQGTSLVRQLSAQLTILEDQAASRVCLVTPSDLPPAIRECFTTNPFPPQKDITITQVETGCVEKAIADDNSNGAICDPDSDDSVPERGRGRLASLLGVQGYGLDVTNLQRPTARYMQQARKRKHSGPQSRRDTKGLNNLNVVLPPRAAVLSDSFAIRAEFKEEFDSSFFPRSYQVTEIYLPRTIYENHSLRYRAKKRIRPDRDTLSGLIVTLRKESPPWGFT